MVAVVVVHDPGPWFDDTLTSFARQDYPNLRFLFLVAPGEPRPGAPSAESAGAVDQDLAAVEARITARLPGAFVRSAGANPGFGTVANVIVIGLVTDATLALLDRPSALALRVLLLVGGIVLNGLAGALYIGSQFGPGPRDGLMTGLARRTGAAGDGSPRPS